MPRRGYTVFSKFVAAIPLNLLFMAAGVVGNLIGTVLFTRIGTDGRELQSLGTFLLKFLLIQSIDAILLLVTASLRSKSLGSVLAVLMGTGLMSLIYFGISSGIGSALRLPDFDLGEYMPDQLLQDPSGKPMNAILSAAVTTVLFLQLAVQVFDRRDVK